MDVSQIVLVEVTLCLFQKATFIALLLLLMIFVHGISISPVVSNLFQHDVLNRSAHYSVTFDNQFGFKKHIGCRHVIVYGILLNTILRMDLLLVYVL